eukprot:TRINITY_DN4753_c0_g1_i1.p1 TRINITY_DN4753_c0_g1~~TRINITY_DN4753_c0_g1_i1.p1  ORF type:complete len:249 (+),score=20.86 TRINITY_DN4753_c0_g1_i1:775-1521(+)
MVFLSFSFSLKYTKSMKATILELERRTVASSPRTFYKIRNKIRIYNQKDLLTSILDETPRSPTGSLISKMDRQDFRIGEMMKMLDPTKTVKRTIGRKDSSGLLRYRVNLNWETDRQSLVMMWGAPSSSNSSNTESQRGKKVKISFEGLIYERLKREFEQRQKELYKEKRSLKERRASTLTRFQRYLGKRWNTKEDKPSTILLPTNREGPARKLKQTPLAQPIIRAGAGKMKNKIIKLKISNVQIRLPR